MSCYHLQILGLCETRWNGKGLFSTLSGELLLYSGNNDSRTRRVELLLTLNTKKALLSHSSISDGIITARFNSKFRKITIVQCNASTEVDEDTNKDAFYEHLLVVLASLLKSDIRIVMNDFNAKVGNDNSNLRSVIGRQSLHNNCNNNGSRLLDLCVVHQLFVGLHKDSVPRYSQIYLRMPGRTYQEPDLLISKKFLRCFLDVKTFKGADAYSDHQLLMGILKLRPAAISTTSEPRCASF